MLKIIATTRSECTTKYENKASYNTDYIVSGLIDIFGDDWKQIRKQVEKRNVYICERLKTSLLKAFFMYFLSTIWKNNVLAICISYQKPKPNSLFSELFIYEILKENAETNKYRGYLRMFVLTF